MKISLKLLKECCAVTLTRSSWNAKGTADLEKVQTDCSKEMLSMSKSLIQGVKGKGKMKNRNSYEAIKDFMAETRQYLIDNCNIMPGFKGCYLVRFDRVGEIDDELERRKGILVKELVPAFVRDYPELKEKARQLLGTQFCESDYPATVEDKFGLAWNWITFDIPDSLPEAMKQKEAAKLEKRLQEATEEITLALREAFQKIITHAVDKLKPDEDGKVKQFRKETIENIEGFINAFKTRNITDDVELAKLIEQARKITIGITDAQELRESVSIRESVASKLETIKNNLDGMIEKMPRRKFSFDE